MSRLQRCCVSQPHELLMYSSKFFSIHTEPIKKNSTYTLSVYDEKRKILIEQAEAADIEHADELFESLKTKYVLDTGRVLN